MAHLIEALTKSQTVDQAYNAAAAWLAENFKADSVDILLGTVGGGLVLKASTVHPELADRIRLAKGIGFAGHVVLRGRLVSVEEGLSSSPYNRNLPGLPELPYEACLAIPLQGEKDPDGVILIRSETPRVWDDAEKKQLKRHATDLGLALKVFETGFKAGSQSNRFGMISEVAKSLSDSPYLEEILQLLVNLTARRFNYRVVTVRLLDETNQELILRATQATNKAYQRKRAIKLGESIAGKVIRENETAIIEDVQTEPDYIGHDLAQEQGLRSMICVPLSIQGRAVGVLSCYTGEVREFNKDEVNALETLATQAAVSIEHARLQSKNTLMQEMHHRVKNNLQQVASLLRLQLRQSHYKSLEEALNDSLSRILAIAAVHELLSRDDLDHVSIKHIAEMLVQHQSQSFLLPGKNIRFVVKGDDVHLNTTQATQVSLILNEMIQNAVEHGFAISEQGEIHITVEDRDGDLGIWVSNNGDPLPPGFDLKTGQLGLQIIRSLAGALGAAFSLEDRLGWTVGEVTFTRRQGE